MKYICCILIGYLIGTINPAYLLSRHSGMDIREHGSGNAGASNALILFGKLRGALCALFDISKASLAIGITTHLFPTLACALALTGGACMLGHMFPFYMGFRGGKGLACLGGMILRYDWRIFLLMLAGEAIVALVTNYICFVPITASVIFPAIYARLSHDLFGTAVLSMVAVAVIFRHLENLVRIRQGKELRLSYLWNREGEAARLRAQYPDEEDALDRKEKERNQKT